MIIDFSWGEGGVVVSDKMAAWRYTMFRQGIVNPTQSNSILVRDEIKTKIVVLKIYLTVVLYFVVPNTLFYNVFKKKDATCN